MNCADLLKRASLNLSSQTRTRDTAREIPIPRATRPRAHRTGFSVGTSSSWQRQRRTSSVWCASSANHQHQRFSPLRKGRNDSPPPTRPAQGRSEHRVFQHPRQVTTITFPRQSAKRLKWRHPRPRPDRDRGLQDSTGQSHSLRLRRSHGHNISAASFGFIEALVRDFEQLFGC